MRLLILFSFFPLLLHAQPGCPDPQASNFDPSATVNDGSCEYSATLYAPPLIGQLPPDLEECSGLAFFDDQLWTHLDGGNLDRLFTLDTLTAEKLQTITIPNADNQDWEDLAGDEDHLYIGDFGNNFGNRTDLRIYKIEKSDLAAGTISPELIEFSYSDQTSFPSLPNNNDFDCEAFFFWEDSLHLFSKNWVNSMTRHYVLSAEPGNHIAQLRDSFDVKGLVTSADVSDEGTVLLLGYNDVTSETFFYLLFDFEGSDFFSGNKRKISLGSAIGTSQTEGIVFRDLTRGYICSERFSVLPQKLMSFDVKQWIENPVSAAKGLEQANSFSLYPNPTGGILNLKIEREAFFNDCLISIWNEKSQLAYERKWDQNAPGGAIKLDVSFLKNGTYWLSLTDGNKFFSQQFHKHH